MMPARPPHTSRSDPTVHTPVHTCGVARISCPASARFTSVTLSTTGGLYCTEKVSGPTFNQRPKGHALELGSEGSTGL